MRRAPLFAALLLAAGAAAADEPERLDPDWPCVQRKVPALTPAAIWTGPAIDGVEDWAADPEVARLVGRLSQRRVPMETAKAAISAFAEATPPERRAERLTALFAGLFEVMDAERGEIIEGVERFARRQKALAERIRAQFAGLEAAPPGSAEATEAQARMDWDRRIFEERRQSTSYICEVPRLVEQRLFALGRAIAEATPDG
jgi:hypothetical protein